MFTVKLYYNRGSHLETDLIQCERVRISENDDDKWVDGFDKDDEPLFHAMIKESPNSDIDVYQVIVENMDGQTTHMLTAS